MKNSILISYLLAVAIIAYSFSHTYGQADVEINDTFVNLDSFEDFAYRDAFGNTPIFATTHSYSTDNTLTDQELELFKALHSYPDAESPKSIAEISALVDHVENINAYCNNSYCEEVILHGETLLIATIYYGTLHKDDALSIVKLLVAKGADVNLPNKPNRGGETPLMRAIAFEQTGIIEFLLKAGAHTEATDSYYMTALMFAVNNDDCPDIVQLLVDHGALVNVKDQEDFTPLFYAILANNESAVKILLENGADLSFRYGFRGADALMIAASEGNAKIVRMLLDAGVSPITKDDFGRQAEYYATTRAENLEKEMAARATFIKDVKETLSNVYDVDPTSKDLDYIKIEEVPFEPAEEDDPMYKEQEQRHQEHMKELRTGLPQVKEILQEYSQANQANLNDENTAR